MKKIYAWLWMMLLSVALLVGCGQESDGEKIENVQEQQTEVQGFPVTVKDATGEEVVIEAKPERIVSLMPSNTEIAFALGLSEEIVGVNDYDNYPEEALEKEKIGGIDFNVEKIISLQPDLVLAHGGTSMGSSPEGLQQIRDAGITVFVVHDATNFETVYHSISLIGKATGKQEEAEQLVTNMKMKIEEIQSKLASITSEDKKNVYVEISASPDIMAAGKNTFIDEILTTVNANNIITAEGWPKIDQETIIESNPDVIMTTYGFYVDDPVAQVIDRVGWQDINAVKNKHVVDVHSDKVTRPGPRLVEGVEELAKAIYPDVFK